MPSDDLLNIRDGAQKNEKITETVPVYTGSSNYFSRELARESPWKHF